jgi:hypothetical protein
MEFMSQGVPVVVSRTKIDSFYFQEGDVHFFPSGDRQALANAILDVVNNAELRESLVRRGYEYAERHGWGRKKKEYLDLIDSLSTERFDSAAQAIPGASPLSLNGNQVSSEDRVRPADTPIRIPVRSDETPVEHLP